MSSRRHKGSKAAEIVQYLLTHPRQTTADIAQAVDWTTSKVASAMWSEIRRTPCVIVRDEIPPTCGRTKPTYVYSHVDYKPRAPVGLPPPELETTKPEQPTITAYGPYHTLEEAQQAAEALRDQGAYTPIKDRAIFVEELAQPPETEGTLTDFADALAKAIAQHVVSRVKDHLETQLQAILPPMQGNPTPISIEQLTARAAARETAKLKAPTVLIAGLLPNQAGIIDKEFGDVFDLRFYMVGHNLKQLASMAANVDHVFTFTSKVSHAVEEVMVGKGHKIHRCSGGMTMLKDQLLKLYMGEL